MDPVLICAVCSKADPLCNTKLDIPICSRCWMDPGQGKKRMFSFNFAPEIDKITSKIFQINGKLGSKLSNISFMIPKNKLKQ